MKKTLSLIMSLVFAHEHDFTEAKQIIDSKLGCDKLNDKQLELIGDYYMEQMHPGSAHEAMDSMMGGEGSQSLKQIHIQMAKRFYCNENVGGIIGGGMMNTMQGGMINMMGNMMGGGMMGPFWSNNYGSYGYSAWSPVYSILSLVLFALIIYFGFNAFQERNKNNKWLWLLIGSVALLILFGSTSMGGFGMMGVGLGFGMLMMILFWGAVIWFIVALVKSAGKDSSEEPLVILKKRYAQGEITKKQYEEMKKELK